MAHSAICGLSKSHILFLSAPTPYFLPNKLQINTLTVSAMRTQSQPHLHRTLLLCLQLIDLILTCDQGTILWLIVENGMINFHKHQQPSIVSLFCLGIPVFEICCRIFSCFKKYFPSLRSYLILCVHIELCMALGV